MISISNIAWDTSLDIDVSNLMSNFGVSYIDIAPPKYFKDSSNTKDSKIIDVRNFWLNKKIQPLGMQSLLFGTQGLNVFGASEIQDKLLTHLKSICHIGSTLGARKLVFGSPRNRDRARLNDIETMEIAVSFFNRLGDIAKEKNVVICLEPNPTCYHANFMTNSLETAQVVDAINHKNIRMQLDIGAMIINDENPKKIIKKIAPLVHHIHISEPQLAPLNINNPFHRHAADAINCDLPEMPLTIEMLTTDKSATLQEIETAIKLIQKVYQGQ